MRGFQPSLLACFSTSVDAYACEVCRYRAHRCPLRPLRQSPRLCLCRLWRRCPHLRQSCLPPSVCHDVFARRCDCDDDDAVGFGPMQSGSRRRPGSSQSKELTVLFSYFPVYVYGEAVRTAPHSSLKELITQTLQGAHNGVCAVLHK